MCVYVCEEWKAHCSRVYVWLLIECVRVCMCVCVWKATCQVWLKRFHKKMNWHELIFVATINVVFLEAWTTSSHYNDVEVWSVLECRYSCKCIFITRECLRVLACVVYSPCCCVRLSVCGSMLVMEPNVMWLLVTVLVVVVVFVTTTLASDCLLC